MEVDMTKFASTESNDLKAADFVGKNLPTHLSDEVEVTVDGVFVTKERQA